MSTHRNDLAAQLMGYNLLYYNNLVAFDGMFLSGLACALSE